MADSDDQVPLLERVEMPSKLPKELQRKMTLLQDEFADAQVEHMRVGVNIMRPVYAKRNELIASKLKDLDFWPRVFSNLPAEVDEFILPSDSEIFNTCLKNLNIERIGIDEKGEGEPRSLRFTFEFDNSEANVWFDDAKLVKDFHWRRELKITAAGKRRVWEGLVSEPVRISWKKNMDPTHGLLDAACDLAEAEKALLKKEKKEKISEDERMNLPEFEKLVELAAKVEAEAAPGNEGEEDGDEDGASPAGLSFFAWFGYRGADVSEKESQAARKEDRETTEKMRKGEDVPGEDDDDEDEDDEDEEDSLAIAEIFADGQNVAIAFGEEVWPEALQCYVDSYMVPGDFEDFEDLDVEEMEALIAGDEDEDEEEEKGEKEERPRKKAKKA
ncbi:NAP family protein [Nannizzia gypsea CBS 118893]|uniref:NAP family protein n=1 Tax=Arthroderma gypseum (strain ATCC MYA-4604 / CBS 118893) TaxID=535722 RepID=E4USK9_ARTGP|nr:NAP family protein [Nannizzia gypsea CBS 118893]EFR01360.1 NAP family protein [Nannizzia gypsea CBS 118893]